MENYTIIAAIIIKNGKILLVRHKPEHGLPDYWGLPGGTAEKTESAYEALVREVKEECGINVPAQPHIAFCTEYMNFKRHWKGIVVTYAFEMNNNETIASLDPDDDILDLELFSTEEALGLLTKNPFPIMKEPLIDYLNNKKFKMWTYHENEDGMKMIKVLDI